MYFSVGHLGYRGTFLEAAGAAVLGAVVTFGLFGVRTPRHKERLLVRRKYLLFYLLTMLDGCRRQVFIAFALFALVKVHGASVREIAVLIAVSQVVNLFVMPLSGRCVDRLGYATTFLTGAFIAVLATITAACVPRREELAD